MKNLFLFLLGGVLFFAAGAHARELLFFCGSAVRMPMDEIIKNYEKKTGAKVSVIYGASGTLLSQMEISRRGDVYLSGSPDYIIIGEKKKLLLEGTAKAVNYLIPAIIVPKGNPKNIRRLKDLCNPGVRFGMGNPETVCLGLYGVEILEKNKILGGALKNIAVFAKSCEDTATLAALGKVDVVLGWDVFASWNQDAVEWVKISPSEIPRISYTAIALPTFVSDKKLATDFINFVLSEESQKVFDRWGYISDLKEAKKHAPKAQIGGEYKIPADFRNALKALNTGK